MTAIQLVLICMIDPVPQGMGILHGYKIDLGMKCKDVKFSEMKRRLKLIYTLSSEHMLSYLTCRKLKFR